MPLIRNKIFGMCTIWVILGVNVIYLSVMRNLILINFFTVKFPVICYHFKWIFVEKTAKENCFAIIVTVINTVNQYFLGCKPFSWRKLFRYAWVPFYTNFSRMWSTSAYIVDAWLRRALYSLLISLNLIPSVLVCSYVSRSMSSLSNNNTVIRTLHAHRLIVSVLEKYLFCRDVL